MRELPDPDVPLSDLASQKGLESVNRLANPHAITSVNIENDFGGNEEHEKRVLYHYH